MQIQKTKNDTKAERFFLFLALISFTFSFLIGKAGLIFLGLTFILFLLVVFLKKRRFGNYKKSFLKLFDFFSDISVYVLVSYIIALIVLLPFEILGIKISNIDKIIELASPIFMLIIVMLAGPIEELIFRAGLLNLSRKTIFRLLKHKDIWALLFSSFVFALFHIIGNDNKALYLPLYFVPMFVMGLIFGKIYLKRGLLEVMWLHSLFNLFNLFLAYILNL